MIKVPKKYWHIAKRLTTAQLQKDDSKASYFDERDLFNINIGNRGHSFFLGYYSKEGLKLAFEKYGLIKRLGDIGYDEIYYDLDTSDPYVHRLTLFDRERRPDRMLIEVVLKRDSFRVDMPFEHPLNGRKYETLAIEWLCMQNPKARFTKKRPKIPGQKYPGLGMASLAVELLIISSWRLHLSGLLNNPEHYHNALLYSRIFFYIDPRDQGRLLAMHRDTGKYPLHMVAWALEWGAVWDEVEQSPASWFAAKQIVPLNEELKNLFNSRQYRKLAKEESKKYKYHLNEDTFNTILKDKGGLYEA